MAERGGPGRWFPAPRNRRLPARGRSFALLIEHFSAPCARRMVRERGEAAPQGEKHPCPVRRRCCDGVRRLPRRPTGLRCSGQATCPVWAHASSRQDALHRFPQLPIRWERPSGSGWDIVHLPWLLPRVGKVDPHSWHALVSSYFVPHISPGGSNTAEKIKWKRAAVT